MDVKARLWISGLRGFYDFTGILQMVGLDFT